MIEKPIKKINEEKDFQGIKEKKKTFEMRQNTVLTSQTLLNLALVDATPIKQTSM